MNTAAAASFTPLESYLLFQSLVKYGIDGKAFGHISNSLRNNAFIKSDDAYNADRLNSESLQGLFLQLLRDELQVDDRGSSRSNGDSDATASVGPAGSLSPTSASRKRKLSSPPLPTLAEARAYADRFPVLVERLYARYREHIVTAIRDDERRIERVRAEIRALEQLQEAQKDEQKALQPGKAEGDRSRAQRTPDAPASSTPLASAVNGKQDALRALAPGAADASKTVAYPNGAGQAPLSVPGALSAATVAPTFSSLQPVPTASRPMPLPPSSSAQPAHQLLSSQPLSSQPLPTSQQAAQARPGQPAEQLRLAGTSPEAQASASKVPPISGAPAASPHHPLQPAQAAQAATALQTAATSFVAPQGQTSQPSAIPVHSPSAQNQPQLTQKAAVPPAVSVANQASVPFAQQQQQQQRPVLPAQTVFSKPLPANAATLQSATQLLQPHSSQTSPPPQRLQPLQPLAKPAAGQLPTAVAAQTASQRPVLLPSSAKPAAAVSIAPGQQPPPSRASEVPDAALPTEQAVTHPYSRPPLPDHISRISAPGSALDTPTPVASPRSILPQTPVQPGTFGFVPRGSGTRWKQNNPTPSTPGPEIGGLASPAFEPISPVLAPRPGEAPGPTRKALEGSANLPRQSRQPRKQNAAAPSGRPRGRPPRHPKVPVEVEDDTPPIKDEIATPKPLYDVGETTTEDGGANGGSRTASPRRPSSRSLKRKRDESIDFPSPGRLQAPTHAQRRRPVPSTPPTHVLWMRGFPKISASALDQISSHRHANMFAHKIRDRDAPGYDSIVRHPVDLKSIRMAISQGNKAAMAAAASLPESDQPSASSVWLPISEELVPPRGIVNSSQLESELVHMFANAIMYNPDPHRGPGPAFMLSEAAEDEAAMADTSIGGTSARYKVDEDGVVNDTRDMYVEVEKFLSEMRSAEKQRDVPPPPADARGLGLLTGYGDTGSANEDKEDGADEGDADSGGGGGSSGPRMEASATVDADAEGSGTIKRRRMTRGL